MRCNRKQLAALLGCDVRTIDAMVGKGMPYLARPGEGSSRSWSFDSGRVIDWMIHGDIGEQIKQQDLRIARARATTRELDVAERLGLRVRVDD